MRLTWEFVKIQLLDTTLVQGTTRICKSQMILWEVAFRLHTSTDSKERPLQPTVPPSTQGPAW